MEGGASRLSALSGLARRDPLIGTAMFIFMLALAGVPPLAGFMSKFPSDCWNCFHKCWNSLG